MRLALTGFLLLAACAGKGPADVTAEVSPVIGTVVTVRWTTSDAVAGYVEYGTTEDLGMVTATESEPTTDHEVVILGLSAQSDVYFRAGSGEGDDAAMSDVQTITTDPLSNTLPQLDVTGDGNDQYTVIPVLGDVAGPSILGPNGDFVWFYADSRDLDVYRARLSRDGKSVLYNAASVSGDPAPNSALVRVSLDGTEETSIEIPLLAHDFVEMADGTIGTMVVEYRNDADGNPIRGDQIVEVHPDGTQEVAWSSWDCFDPAVDTGSASEIGWTFANALDYSEAEDAYYLSMRNFSTIAKIDRGTRTCPWRFGTTAQTVTPTPAPAIFLHEHQFQINDGSILVFDNDGSTGTESRVLEFSWDGVSDTATQTWEYHSDPPVYTFVLGDVDRLPGGDTMVDWAVGGQIDRVKPDGSVTWRVNTQLGYAFGFFEVTSTLYDGGTSSDRTAAGE